jgi:hypothetical protein
MGAFVGGAVPALGVNLFWYRKGGNHSDASQSQITLNRISEPTETSAPTSELVQNGALTRKRIQ